MYCFLVRTRSGSLLEMICNAKDLCEMTLLFDRSDMVIEYKITSGGTYFTNNTIGFHCEKLVEIFYTNKEVSKLHNTDDNYLYYEQLWEKYKPNKKLPVEFDRKLKECFISAAREVWDKSKELERARMIKDFPSFVQERYFASSSIPTAY